MPSKYDGRPSARQRGYTSRWERYRRAFLQRHPLCVMCEAEGRLTPATVVDHIVPHKGDHARFWSPDNHQALCKPHHDRDKQRIERGTQSQAIGADGWPVEP